MTGKTGVRGEGRTCNSESGRFGGERDVRLWRDGGRRGPSRSKDALRMTARTGDGGEGWAGGLRGAREGLGWAEARSQKRDLGHPALGSHIGKPRANSIAFFIMALRSDDTIFSTFSKAPSPCE